MLHFRMDFSASAISQQTTDPLILLVDDEVGILTGHQAVLRRAGFRNVVCENDPRRALAWLKRQEPDVAVFDLLMPEMSGQLLLEEARARYPDLPVMITTGMDDARTAMDCIRAGAFDYLVKPFQMDVFLLRLRQAVETHRLRLEGRLLARALGRPAAAKPVVFDPLIAASSAMQAVLRHVELVAPSSRPVLILGDTGVGKELVAKALHAASGLPGRFVAVNPAGVDDALLADTLFGHCRGAFTGADADRPGLVEEAAGGTLFFDEIGDLSPVSQLKLLRLIQENDYLPLGSPKPRPASARFVFATHCDLPALCQRERFRSDLYYRISFHEIHIPPLRERVGDIPPLANHFIAEAAAEFGYDHLRVSPEVMPFLLLQPLPGNARELRSMIWDAVGRNLGRELTPASFRPRSGMTPAAASGPARRAGLPVSQAAESGEADAMHFPGHLPTLAQVEFAALAEALRRTGGRQAAAAKLLGISQSAVSRRLARPFPGQAAVRMRR